MNTDEARRQIAALFRDAAADLFATAMIATSGRRDDANDLVQEVFHAAWKAWPTVADRDAGGQRAWLFVTLRNKFVDSCRRGQREVSLAPTEMEIIRAQHRARVTPTRQAIAGAALDRCWRAIKEMPPVRQTVLLLKAYEWTNAEIAEHLQITQSTVRDHCSIGRRELNGRLGPECQLIEEPDPADGAASRNEAQQ
jgi:RNA polymerase sigma factor (sigma-70 family)